MKLNLGCGRYPIKDFVNIDISGYCKPDKIWDIEWGFPWLLDNTVEYIFTSHTLEHVNKDKFIYVMNECWRVLENGGRMEIVVPSGNNLERAWRDPTHKNLFFEGSFFYFCRHGKDLPPKEDYGIEAAFERVLYVETADPQGNALDIHITLQKVVE